MNLNTKNEDMLLEEVLAGGRKMGKPVKEMFLEIVEEWEDRWKDEIAFHDFLDEYVEINDDKRTYIIKKRQKRPEFV